MFVRNAAINAIAYYINKCGFKEVKDGMYRPFRIMAKIIIFNFYKSMQIKSFSKIQPIINNNYCHKVTSTASCAQFDRSDFQISREMAEAIKIQKLSFRGAINSEKAVTTKDIYKKFLEQANNYTLEDIKEVYNNISKRVESKGIEASPQEIKYTMGLLTQYATPDGMVNLAKEAYKQVDTAFFKCDSPDTTQFMRYLQTKKEMLPEERYDTAKYSEEETKYSDYEDYEDFLSCQKHLKFTKKRLKNEQYKKYDDLYYFVDKKSMKYISGKDRRNLFDKNPIALCATGWDRGNNFLDPKIGFDELEKNAAEVIIGAKEKYPNEKFNTALNKFLNDEASEYAKNEGFKDIHFVSITPEDKTVEFEDILNNLNIKIPSEKQIEIVTDSIAEVFEEKNTSYQKKDDVVKSALLKYFYNTFNVFSPKTMAEDMKELYKKIEEVLPKGKSMDDVKIILPDMTKSYVYIIRQFASVNDIDPKNIHTGENCANLEEIQKKRIIASDYVFPYQDDVILSIDDNALSGTSIYGYGGNSFGYNHYPRDWYLNNTYIFGRLYATDTAEEKINELIASNKENHTSCEDKFVCVKQIKDNLLQVPYTEEEEKIVDKALDLYHTYWGTHGFQETKINTVFPMTAPDNNSGLANFLALQFFSDKNFIKEPTLDSDIRNLTFKKIEEKTKELNV